MQRACVLSEDGLHRIFRATPHPYLALTPAFLIVGANDAYLRGTLTDFAAIEGRYIFDVFPDNPMLTDADGVKNLSASLRYVVKYREPHQMAVQRYDIRTRDRLFIERHWKPVNYPVFGEGGRLAYILHHVVDVTNAVIASEQTTLKPRRGDYDSKAEYCAARAAASDSEESRTAWLSLERQYRLLDDLHQNIERNKHTLNSRNRS